MFTRRLIVSLIVAAATLAAVPHASAAKAYRADRFDIRLSIQPDGSMLVTETIRFVFGADTFTYVFRELPVRRIDALAIVGASMDGTVFTPGKNPLQFDVKREKNNRRRVTWHFAPVSGAAHEFVLTYRVEGVVEQQAEADSLRWLALPDKHEYAIGCSQVDVEYPAATRLIAAPSLAPPAVTSSEGGNPLRFRRCAFDKDDSWLVELRFEPRTLAVNAPAWQQHDRLTARNMPLLAGLAALILLAGLGAFLVFGLNHRVDLSGDREERQTTPPDSLPAGLAGVLTHSRAAPSWRHVLGTLFDLAGRGVVRIEATPAPGRFRKPEFVVTPGATPHKLAMHEQALMGLLFTTKTGSRPRVRFSEMGRIFASSRRWKRLRTAMSADLRLAGVFDGDRERLGGRVASLGVVITVLGVVGLPLAVVFRETLGDAVFLLPVSVLLVGIAGIAAGAVLSPLSDEGIRRARGWTAYGRYLQEVSKRATDASATSSTFERSLPYAAAFGVALAWAKALRQQGVHTGPSWLSAVPGDERAARHMDATVLLLSAANTAGAHADSAAGGVGVGGAAGGGASGAG